MKVKVYVTLKKGVFDPQGKAVEDALHSLGFSGVGNVRVGKYIEMEINSTSTKEAERQTKEMCEKLLANPVIEDYSFKVEG